MNVKEQTKELITKMRKEVPLIHNITNYVTVNDCANAILAIGASPIMADDIGEAADITSISAALVINVGTLNQRTIESMILAGKKANELGIPIVLDPVGAGASQLRNDTVKAILSEIKIQIIRGNSSEVSYIAGLSVSTKGVDSAEEDNKNDIVAVAKNVAKKYFCVTAITGQVDVVTDGTRVAKISNGHPMLSKVTGTGCMTSALIGAYASVTNDYYSAATAGIATMGIAGEQAYAEAGKIGIGSFHIAIMNALSNIDSNIIEKMAKIEE